MASVGTRGRVQRRGEVSYLDGYVALPGRRLHFVDYGGDGEVVIALHGYVQNAHAFDGVACALVPHVRLLALDCRGRGGSDSTPPQSYRLDYLVRDLRDFLAALGLSRVALIGTSMGGGVAMLYSIAHPLDVTRLVLNDVAVNGNRSGAVRATLRWGETPERFASVSDAMDWFGQERGNLAGLDGAARHAWVSHFLTPDGAGGFRLYCDPVLIQLARHIRPTLRPQQNAFRQMFAAQAARLHMPILILRGQHSDVVTPEAAETMTRTLPAATCVEIPNAGHSPTLYEPAAQAALRVFFGCGT